MSEEVWNARVRGTMSNMESVTVCDVVHLASFSEDEKPTSRGTGGRKPVFRFSKLVSAPKGIVVDVESDIRGSVTSFW